MDLLANFLHFGASDFPSKNPFKKCFKIVFFSLWRRDPILELQFPTPLRVLIYCVLQLSLCRSHCNGCVKVAACCGQPWRSHYNAICRDWVAKHNRTTRNGVGNCSSKTGSRRQSEKKTILKDFLKGFLERKSLAPKWRKSADKPISQPSCSHSNTIYEIQLQKTIVRRMQPQHAATLTQPLQCDLQRLSCKTQYISTRNGVGNCSSKIGSRRHSEKKTILKHFLKGFLEGKSLAPKWRKFANKSMSQPSCSDSNTIYEIQLQKTIVLRMQPQHAATLTQPLQCDLQRLSSKTQ